MALQVPDVAIEEGGEVGLGVGEPHGPTPQPSARHLGLDRSDVEMPVLPALDAQAAPALVREDPARRVQRAHVLGLVVEGQPLIGQIAPAAALEGGE
jgi:hypothetical protein